MLKKLSHEIIKRQKKKKKKKKKDEIAFFWDLTKCIHVP